MAIKLTVQQQQAISHRGGSLIVSAAAGAGKTAVLVRRVLSLICDGDAPCDIDQLLIVTFTNAAAAEMRGRIADALNERLAQQPYDRHLRRQLALLPQSRIQTVHAFCQTLLRQNFALCDISPDFALADDVESTMLKERAMEQLLEAQYAAPSEAFLTLSKTVSEEWGDRRLAQVIQEVYDKLRSHPAPDKWLEFMAQPSGGMLEEATWGKYLLQGARDRTAYALRQIRIARETLRDEPKVEEKYAPAFDACIAFGEALLQALQQGWNAAKVLLDGFEKPTLSAVRNADKEFTGAMQRARNAFFDRMQKLRQELLLYDTARLQLEEKLARPQIACLCGLVREFTRLYDAEKKARNLLDFSDLEHLAMGLLTDPQTGGKSPLAQELSSGLREVLVDEYQDTNEIQEQIFKRLSPEQGGMFFVGDVKQSIYRFRLAEPTIFIDRYQSSEPVAAGAQRSRLELNSNFRSRPEVLSLCNFVFSRIMSQQFGDIDYDDGQRLYAGRKCTGQCPAELYVIDSESDDDENDEEKIVLEARLAANRIRQMLQQEVLQQDDGTSRPYRPSDFAILLSSYTSRAPYFSRELERAGIPCSAGSGDFFGSVEISVMLSLLKVIDNRRQDIPLISLMRSPLYLFTPDELAAIRVEKKNCDYYEAVQAAAQAGNAHAAQLIADLDQYASDAMDLPLAQLLQTIYARTGAEGIFAALEGGELRRRNLQTLYQLALSFESGEARGLYAFLQYLERRAQKDEPVGGTAAQGDMVQIMSIHKSKGLEYPVVLLPDLAKRFNTDDVKKRVLFHQHMGIGLRLRDHVLHGEYKSQMYAAIATRTLRELRSEEMRKLYVAMTRAREKLILIASMKDPAAKIDAIAENCACGIEPEYLVEQGTAFAWLCAALLQHPGAVGLRQHCRTAVLCGSDAEEGELTCHVLHSSEIEMHLGKLARPAEQAQPEEDLTPYLQRQEQRYAYADVTGLPSKAAVTGAWQLLPDTGEVRQSGTKVQLRLYRQVEEVSQQRLTAAQRGTALHRFLQLADFGRCATKDGVAEEVRRLAERGALTPQEAAAVPESQMAAFISSTLGRRVLAAQQLWREYQFGTLLTQKELCGAGSSEEQILLNGAVDLLLQEEGGLVIVDFKSDRIRPGEEAARGAQYALQLRLYALAVEKVFCLPVRQRIIYFLETGNTAEIEA